MSSAKALNAILPLIGASQAYEAHQKARTFAARYAKSGQFDTAIDVLFQSARELFKAGELGSGTDLTTFLLDVYEQKGEEVNEESRGRLTQLIALVGSKGAWRKTMIDKSIAWSAKHGPCPAGDQDLNHYVGELLYKEGIFVTAEVYLLAAGKRDSARLLAQLLVEWSAVGGDVPPGTFALRGTIPYLINGNILAARAFITQFTTLILTSNPSLLVDSSSEEVKVTTDSVLNFCQLAVITCQRAQGAKNKPIREAWVRLCGTYQSKGGVLSQPEIRTILNEIAILYFGILPPRTQAANPLADMMASMMGGGALGGGAQPTRRALAPPPAVGAALD